MSRPFQNPSFNSSNSNSPLSPHPRGETPVSFRTNVNRAKTKRWVEAKKYSYDGDDWGEDEYGEYEDDQSPAPESQPPSGSADQSTGDIPGTASRDASRHPLPSMDRSHSMDQVSSMAAEGPASSPASVIRPADIYRRMREDQKSREQAPNQAPPRESAAAVGPMIDTPPASSAPAVSGEPIPENREQTLDTQKPAPSTGNDVPILSLPDVKRLSGFGSDFMPTSNSSIQKDPEPEDQGSPQLQHNPSLGFRSAVHQAFDVPDTPSTTIESVGRSNSDSTTAISPIIGNRGAGEDKTPTIEEDPRENMPTPTEGDIVFKPGHRRDLSLPSPGNSPSRKPVITNPEPTAPSVLGQLSPETPSATALDIAPSSQQDPTPVPTIQASPSTSVHDLPAPLNVNTNVPPESSAGVNNNVPVIIPSMSADNSPQDTENDRLRKEIIRSLSRENTPSDQQEQETPPQTGRQDSLIPSEYERYWSEERPSSPPQDAPVPGYNPSQPTPEIPPPQATAPAPPTQTKKPKLQRRFSWEESSADEDATPVTQTQSPPVAPMPGQFPLSQENSFHKDLETTTHRQSLDTEPEEGGTQPGIEKPKLTIVPPSTADSISLSSTSNVQETVHSQTTDDISWVEESSHSVSADHQHSELAASTSFETSSLLGFKDILGMQSSEERVKAFNQTRDQFAAIDTGLHNWIKVTFSGHPEYVDVVEQSAKLPAADHKPSVPRAKFPKLSSLGNFGSLDSSPSTLGHIRRPSAPLGSMKQGKDILHTAGVLGGQAGKAAKGFFSKSRNKLKGGGGSEKGFQSTRGFHRPVRLSDLQPDVESGIDLDDPQRSTARPENLANRPNDPQSLPFIPVSRPWTASRNDDQSTSKARGWNFAIHADSDSTPSDQPQRQEQNSATKAGADAADEERPARLSDAIQGHKEHSSSPSNCADCRRVEQTGAKPEPTSSSRNYDGFNHPIIDSRADASDATSSPLATRPSQPSALMDHPPSQASPGFPATTTTTTVSTTTTIIDQWRGDHSQLALRQLPSVSSLGAQDADLGPPTPLPLKLAQHNNSSQVSLPSDVDDTRPRHLGRPFRPFSQRNRPRDNPDRLPQSPLARREAESSSSRSRLSTTVFPPSQPRPSSRPQSTPSIQHEWSRPPEQISLSRDPASHKPPSTPMEKLKNVGHFRRISMGSNHPDSKAAQPQKKPFSRLSGLFGRGNARHQHRNSGPPSLMTQSPTPESRHTSQYLEPFSSRPNSRITRSSISSVDHQDSLSIPDGHSTFQGQRPPVEGYFAPDSLTLVHPAEQAAGPNGLDPTRLSYTSPTEPGRLSPQSPPYRLPGSPQRQTRVSSPRLSSPLPSPVPRTPPSRGRSEERTYAQDLHLRSRSPKVFPPREDEQHLPNDDFTDPAYKLGTFRSNPRTSRCGDQELPWKITIPGESDEIPRDSSATWRQETTAGVLNCSRLPTYQEDAEEHGLSEEHIQHPRDEKRPPPPALRLDNTIANSITPHNNTHYNNPRDGPDPTRATPNAHHNLSPPAPETHHPHRSGARAINTTASPIELPVQVDDNSSEEIFMSSTAYPGQEWRPLGLSEWDHQ